MPAGGGALFYSASYDQQGRKASQGAGVAALTTTGFSYDGISRLSSYSHGFVNGVGNVTTTLGYNPSSQITSEARSNSDYVWASGVDVARNYTVNGLNQYVAAGPASFTYDANGNLTSDGTSSYVYDAENRLVSASSSGGTTLSYDPLGRLWQTSTPNTGTVRLVYEGHHVALEYDGAGAMLRRYFWGPGADEPIIQDEGGALDCTGTRFLLANHQSSVIAASNCAGNRLATNRYDEYGIPQSGNWGRFQYTGQAWLPELGMYYYKARIYSATLGRFLQTDPIGYDDQVNLYAYVGNDPINKTDPTGRIAVVDDLVIGGGIVLAGAICAATDCITKATEVFEAVGDAMAGLISEARSKVDPDGDPAAQGQPHSVPDGKGGYTTYGPRDPITGKPESTKQYRPAPGRPHGPITRPNVKERPVNTRPDGARVPGKPVVRPPKPDEIPKPPKKPNP